MLIFDLTTGTHITIEATIGEEKVTFETEIDEVIPKKRVVLAAPIYKDGKLVVFKGKGLVTDVLVTPTDDKPQLFKNVSINLMKKSDDSYWYNLVTLAASKPLNRRRTFRCYVGVATSARIGNNKSAQQIVIRDVSVEGFGFVCSKELDIPMNVHIHAVFNDYIEEYAENFNFQLYGTIVRRQELDEQRYIYGCKLISRIKGLDAYIVKKERVHLMKERASNV